MIGAAFDALEAATSTQQACRLLGKSRATHYRRSAPPVHGPPRPRPAPPNKLTEAERQRVQQKPAAHDRGSGWWPAYRYVNAGEGWWDAPRERVEAQTES